VDADLDRRSAEGGGAHASTVTTTAFALAIVAAGLRKAFGDHVVLDGVDLCVPARLSLRCSARTVPARRPRSTSARHVDQMAAGNVLHVKVELDAANSPVKLLFQDDGNLVLYHNRLPALESVSGQPLCLDRPLHGGRFARRPRDPAWRRRTRISAGHERATLVAASVFVVTIALLWPVLGERRRAAEPVQIDRAASTDSEKAAS
jgi:hypothetical protein